MDESLEIRTSVDAVRCLCLSRVARREGHEEAAKRLHDQAVAWTEKCRSSDGRNRSGPPIPTTRPSF